MYDFSVRDRQIKVQASKLKELGVKSCSLLSDEIKDKVSSASEQDIKTFMRIQMIINKVNLGE
jgi:GTP cyclohydrolase II